MSGAWDGTRVLRCVGGPWAGEEHVWTGEDLTVKGWPLGRYAPTPPTNPRHLTWTTVKEADG